uniref:Uncharacterized protein n=1 Tax=Mustela putorius furo TaxID=9669 RepID=M3YEG7_MUSPF
MRPAYLGTCAWGSKGEAAATAGRLRAARGKQTPRPSLSLESNAHSAAAGTAAELGGCVRKWRRQCVGRTGTRGPCARKPGSQPGSRGARPASGRGREALRRPTSTELRSLPSLSDTQVNNSIKFVHGSSHLQVSGLTGRAEGKQGL